MGKFQPFEPTDEQRYSVELMASIGITHEDIALALGISRPTLSKYFRTELDTGKVKIVSRVAESLVRQALSGNTTAAIFFLKTQGRWSERPEGGREGKKQKRDREAQTAGEGTEWGGDLTYDPAMAN